MGEIPSQVPEEALVDIPQEPEARLEYFVPLIEQSLDRTRQTLVEEDYYGRLERGEKISGRVFDARSELYELAMKLAPEARIGDLTMMRELIQPEKGEVSVDISAGTGFLTNAVSQWTEATTYGVDPSRTQLGYMRKNCSDLVVPVYGWPDNYEKLFVEGGIPEGGVDVVTSFGGIHHVDKDRYGLAFQNVAKALKPGGRFSAADVPADSVLQRHFDEVVDHKCLTRHPMGRFMSPGFLRERSEEAGLELVRSEIKALTWDFNSPKEMGYFFKGLHAYDQPVEEVIEDLRNTLGVQEEDGKFKLNWPMLAWEIQKPR